MEKTIKEQLLELSEENYRNFTAALTPGKESILGVRLPKLRKLAKEIVKGDWRKYLSEAQDDSMEELLLQGMVISYCKAELEEVLTLCSRFVPKIDCWPVCDSFCGGLKITVDHRARVWEFLQPYLEAEKEYEIRFGVVMLLYYIQEEYAPLVFAGFNRIKHEGYYVKMAVAWVLSMFYVNLPEITMEYLMKNDLDKFTYNKTLQKMMESLKIDADTKKLMKSMKR